MFDVKENDHSLTDKRLALLDLRKMEGSSGHSLGLREDLQSLQTVRETVQKRGERDGVGVRSR